MSISLVGSTSANTAFNTGAVTISYTSSAGNLLVLAFEMADDNGNWASTPFSSVSDSRGNTWHYSTANNSANPPFSYINSAEYTLGVGAGIAWTTQDVGTVTSVTFHNSGATTSYDLLYSLSEWSGVGSVEAGNDSHGTTSGGTGASAGSVTPSDTGDVVIGALFGTMTGRPAGSSQFTVGTGYHTIYVSPATTSPYTANWAAANSQDYVTAVVALKPTAGSVSGTATITGAGTLTAPGVIRSGALTLTGAGVMSGLASTVTVNAVTMTGAGALTQPARANAAAHPAVTAGRIGTATVTQKAAAVPSVSGG